MSNSAHGHFHRLRVAERTAECDDAIVLGLRVPPELAAQFRWQPGQHVALRALVDGQELRRSYSICAMPGEPLLRVGVRRVDGGAFSTWVHKSLQAGDEIDVMPPDGRFVLPPAPPGGRHVLGIAGGSGITPILAIMKTVLATEPRSRFTLVYGNRSVASTMFREEIEDLKNRHLSRLAFHPVFSREPTDSPLTSGRIDAARIRQFASSLIDLATVDQAFVCGPHEMNEAAAAALHEAGLDEARIHVERFGVAVQGKREPQPARPGDAAQARIAIVRDGVMRELDYRPEHGSVLDAAVAAGLDLPYSCKSGMCCTCRARLLEGQVRMERNFALERADLDAGFVLTCQSHPLTPRVVVSFDER